MATPSTRAEFKTYCLRKLGFPVVEINVDDDQVEDRIDDALSYFQDYHFDGTEKMYMKHQLTVADINRRWIYAPDAVTFVTGVFPFDNSNASVNMFDLRYQLRLHDLYDFTSVSYVSYEITMQHIRTLELLFSGTPQFRFNRKQNKVFIDIDWTRDVQVGDYVIIECYRSLNPSTITLTGTVSYTSGSNTVTGYSTTFDQQFLENDFITFNSVDSFQVDKILSPTSLTVRGPMVNTAANVTATISGNSDVWGDRFLKKYAYALIKMQWGNNLKKFAGVQLPGGVTLNGKEIYDEAMEELAKLEEEMQVINVLPNEILIG
jgi:sporulation protein YlmC with PRC-barrel domain